MERCRARDVREEFLRAHELVESAYMPVHVHVAQDAVGNCSRRARVRTFEILEYFDELLLDLIERHHRSA